MAMVITNKEKFADIDLGLYKDILHFADEAAIAHIEPLPAEVLIRLDSEKINLQDCSFYFSDPKTSQALFTIPGGFTFGGGVGTVRNPRIFGQDGKKINKEQPSHDGPTFVSDACKLNNAFYATSANFYTAYQISSNNKYFVGTAHNPEIVEKFDPIPQGTDYQKILSGNEIHIIRAFKENDQDSKSVGTGGGQVSIPLGISNTGTVAALSTNRAIYIPEGKTPQEGVRNTYVGYATEERFVDQRPIGNTIHKPSFSRFKNQNFSR